MTDAQFNNFFSKIDFHFGGCWLWMGTLNDDGYAVLSLGYGKQVYAHRLAYELFIGPTPDELELDHLCRIRNCINPDDLDPVTKQENIRRGETGKHMSTRTHCPQGHEYIAANTAVYNGSRHCKACKAERNRRRYQ